MGVWDSLLIGRSGLSATTVGIATTSHNVANAMTAGFTRRVVEVQTAFPVRQGIGWLGAGVDPARSTRHFDGLLGGRRLAQTGIAGQANTLSNALRTLETAFDEVSGSTPRTALDAFFDALSGATADPSDPSLRTEVANAAGSLASEISGTAETLSADIDGHRSAIEEELPSINAILDEVASLNEALKSAGGGQSAGDLADRRDQLLTMLADSIGARVHFEPDGQATVLLGGHSLVEGGEARDLSLSASDPPTLLVETDLGFVDATASVGGRIGGELAAHATATSWLADLDAFAAEFAAAMNAQHAAGFDAAGNPGGPLFTGTDATTFAVDPAIVADPDALAFASAATAEAGDGGNLLALIALRDVALPSGKTPGETLDALTSRVASETAAAGTDASSASAVLGDLEEMHANLFSVDLDEEAANLIAWQTAYQAQARVIEVASELLDTLMRLR